METLDEEWDLILVGTGMIESILSAAASRIGKKVLHLDPNDYYGGVWTSCNLDGLLKIIENAKTDDGANLQLRNIKEEWYIKEGLTKIETKEVEEATDEVEVKPVEEIEHPPLKKEKEKYITWDKDSLMKEYRKFNIDIIPKLLFTRGELVELLISSNISRYAEFRCINRVLTWIDDRLEPVPCSRTDVFATKNVSVVEKRMLMKLLTSFAEYDTEKSTEFTAYENKTFLEYLHAKKLTSNLVHYVMYAIAGVTEKTKCLEGVRRCKKFLNSLGRYGNTPFLCTIYGCGELPQCFCRLSAVFGGVFCLNTQIEQISIEPEDAQRKIRVSIKEKDLKSEKIVIGLDRAPKTLFDASFDEGISRAIFITNKSILEFNKESLTLLRIPPIDGQHDLVTAIELGPSTSSCPEGLYIVHMTCKQKKTAEEDLLPYAEKILSMEHCDSIVSHNSVTDSKCIPDKEKPKVLWSVFFNIPDASDRTRSTADENVYLCSGPDADLDFDKAVNQAREIFGEMFKDEEFLPRAPDPEEIVFDGEDADPGPVFENQVQNDSVEVKETGTLPDVEHQKTEIEHRVENDSIEPKDIEMSSEGGIAPPAVEISTAKIEKETEFDR